VKKSWFIAIALVTLPGASWAGTIPNPVLAETPGFPYARGNTNLYAGGHWTGTIQIPPGASSTTSGAAYLLQSYLQRIGGPISVTTGTTGGGFKVGLYAEWAPYLPGSLDYLQNNAHDYTLITRGASLRVHAREPETLELAVWRTLEILGYRQLLPTANWEIVPVASAFNANIGILESRPLLSERLFAGEGAAALSDTRALLDDWRRKNRLTSSLEIADYQMWFGLIRNSPYAQEFTDHPEYSSSQGDKLCVMEPRVQAIVIEQVMDKLRANPTRRAASVSASDGSLGWSEPCENGGPVDQGGTGENAMSPSDRQVVLANVVQAALRNAPNGEFAGQHVAMLAYGDTSPRPTVAVDPDVYVTVATAFLKDGLTPVEVAQNYREQGAQNIGYYGYVGTQLWGHGKPTLSKLAQQQRWDDLFIEYSTIVAGSPVPYITGESSSNFGLYGLGNYVFARLNAAPGATSAEVSTRIEQLKTEFLDTAFGPASASMRAYYDLINAGDGQQKLLTTDLLHRLYDHLLQARNATTDAAIKSRIDDLVLYTRSQELWRLAELATTGSADQVTKFSNLAQFVYRIRLTLMYDYYNFFYDPTFNHLDDDMLALFGFAFTPHAVVNAGLWNAAPHSEQEILAILTDGLANNPLFPFTPVTYGTDDLEGVTAFDADPRGRFGEGSPDAFMNVYGDHDWLFYPRAGQTSFQVTAKAGSGTSGEPHPNGPATIQFLKADAETGIDQLLDSVEVESDNVTEATGTFTVPEPALYIVRIVDPGVTVRLKWNKDLNQIVHVPTESGHYHLGGNYSYFYVPLATNEVGVYLGRAGSKVYRPDGTVAYTSTAAAEVVAVPITDAADKGKVWKLYCLGTSNGAQGCYLLNVPPQVARSPKELLLQRSLKTLDGIQ
jgi:hypothetical protein